MLSTSAYITPAIQVAENAYVFAVAMDMDGQIQVLHPDFPGISVKLSAHKPVRLPNFFAGFNQQAESGYYASASYPGYYDTDAGRMDSRGTMIALASRAPFNLEKIEVNGDWDMSAIRRLMDYRSPQAAAQALAQCAHGGGTQYHGREHSGDGRCADQRGACGAREAHVRQGVARECLAAQHQEIAGCAGQ